MPWLFVVALAGAVMLQWPGRAGALDQQFVRGFGGPGTGQVVGVAVDGAGNTYITGFFAGTVDFDRTASTPGDTLTATRDFDGFVLKLDASGGFVWVRGISSHVPPNDLTTFVDEAGAAIAVDGTGNVYIAGSFTFAPVELYDSNGVRNEIVSGSVDQPKPALVLKLDPAGDFVWAHSLGTPDKGHHNGLGLAVDGASNVHVVGSFSGNGNSLRFDSVSQILTGGGGSASATEGYVVTLGSNGGLLWARAFGDASTAFDTDRNIEQAAGVAVDGDGNVYVAGSFRNTVDFDRTSTHPGDPDVLTSQGESDGYLVKLDANGSFVWVRPFGGSGWDGASGVAVQGGAVYVTGLFEGASDFDRTGTQPGGSDILTSQGLYDAFVLKLDPNGGFGWVRSVGGSGYDQGLGVAANSVGSVYVTGIYEGTVDFNPGGGTFPLSNNGGLDAFLLELDANGNFVRADGFGSGNDDRGLATAVATNGSILVGGVFEGTVDFFRTAIVSGDTLTSAGGENGFVVRLAAIADLGVSVVDTPDPVLPGQDLTYAITAQNNGPDPAADATLAVPLPAGTTFVSLTGPGGGWVCTNPAVGTNGTVSCTNPAFSLGSAAFTLVLHAGTAVTAPGTLTGHVSLTTTATDNVPANDSFSVNTALIAAPTITTSGVPLTYVVNQPATALDPGLTITDPDSADLSNGSVQLLAGYRAGQDVLACPACASLGVTASFTVATGRLDLTGTVPVASYQAALRSVTYQNTSDNPSTAARTAAFQVSGAPNNNPSNVATRGITIVRGPSLTIGDVRIEEGDAGTKTASFTVTLHPVSAGPVTVQVRTQDGSATAGLDYVALPPTTLTFAPGETGKQVDVSVTGDTAAEPDEVFTVVLSNPTAASIARTTATGYIINDDSPNPRPQSQQLVTVQGMPVQGRLRVTITADTSVCPAGNTLQRIEFGAARNSRVEVPGAAIGAPGGPSPTPGGPNGTAGDFTLPVNAQSVTFFLQRQAPGDFKVDIAIIDSCNSSSTPFRTFVGGGVGVP